MGDLKALHRLLQIIVIIARGRARQIPHRHQTVPQGDNGIARSAGFQRRPGQRRPPAPGGHLRLKPQLAFQKLGIAGGFGRKIRQKPRQIRPGQRGKRLIRRDARQAAHQLRIDLLRLQHAAMEVMHIIKIGARHAQFEPPAIPLGGGGAERGGKGIGIIALHRQAMALRIGKGEKQDIATLCILGAGPERGISPCGVKGGQIVILGGGYGEGL